MKATTEPHPSLTSRHCKIPSELAFPKRGPLVSTTAEMLGPLAEVSEPGDAVPQHGMCSIPSPANPGCLCTRAQSDWWGWQHTHPPTAIPVPSLPPVCQKQIPTGCFPLTPLAVLTYPRGRCKTGCGNEIAIFPFPFLFFFFKFTVEFPLPFSADLKKKTQPKTHHFIEYSASSWSTVVASGGRGYALAEGMTHEPCLVVGPPRLLCLSPFLSAGSSC